MHKAFNVFFEEIKKDVSELGKGEYEIIGEYIKASSKAKFVHKKCGHEFYLQPTRFIKGGIRCPHCYRSKGEEVIRDFLKEKGFCFKEQYRIKDCKNIRPLPFDFAIFENGIIKCLIEYDGSQHYSPKFNCSKKEFYRIRHNDNIKNEFCKNNNITLIRIKYVRNDNSDIFKNKVIEKLINEFAINNMTIPSQA